MKIDLTKTHDIDGAFKSVDWSDIENKYLDQGTKYCFDVFKPTAVVGYMEKLHAFRHLRDLQRQNTVDFPYHYDLKEVKVALKFAGIIPDVDLKKVLPLMPWQKFILCMLNGWKDKNNERRFTDIHISIGRGQGKTQIAGIQLCKAFIVDTIGFTNKDFLITANTSDQATKLFGYVTKMIKSVIAQEPFKSLAEEVDLQCQSNQIIQKKTNNKIWKISFEADKYDSTHNVLAIYDETGALVDFDRMSDIVDGQAQVSPYHQFIKISSAYPDPTSPFHDEQKIMQQIMEQDYERKGDNSLCLVWSQDDLDETYKPETWAKSNPLINLSKDENARRTKNLMNQRDQALLNNTLHKFQNKNLNLWLKQSTASYLNLADVERATVESFKMNNHEVFIGLDYSMMSDNTALSFVYPLENGYFHIEQHSFIPWQAAKSIEAKENQDGLAYRELAKQGYCTITEHKQGLINPQQVYEWLLDYVEEHQLKVRFFGYDRFGSYQVKNITESLNSNTDWNIMDVRQITSSLADPTKFLQELFITGKVTILDDAVLKKALLNAVIKQDSVGIMVDKNKATLKIDVVDAIIDALYQGMYYFDENAEINSKATEIDRMTEDQVKDWFMSDESGLIGGEMDW